MAFQDLPFPAVTLNAAKLHYPYRLVEAAYSDVKIDCLRWYPWHGNSCEECYDETTDFRRDLSLHIQEMLYQQYKSYSNACREDLETAEDDAKARERIAESLKVDCPTEHYQYLVTAFRAVHACLHNLTNDEDFEFFGSIDIITDMLERTFRVPICKAQDIFEESLQSCQRHRGIVSDDSCNDLIDSLVGDIEEIFCWSYGILKTVVPQKRLIDYKGGIAFKTVWRRERDYFFNAHLGDEALDIINSVAQEQDSIIFPNCTFAEILLEVRRLNKCEINIQEDFWLDKMDLVYRLKKHTIAPSSRMAYEKGELNDIEQIKRVMKTEHNYVFINESNTFTENEYATIMTCKFGDNYLMEDCNMFSNTFTTSGIGYTFNAQPFWTIYENSSSNFAFYKEMYEKEEGFEDKLPRKNINAGQSFSFEFFIRHTPYGYQYRGDVKYVVVPQAHDVLLSIHDPGHIPNLKSEGIVIKPGMSYEIRFSPTVTVTDQSALMLDKETRNCRSKDENDELMLFKYYSQSACLFECKLSQAIRACNCSSWDYPRVEPSASICLDYYSYYMDETYNIENTCFSSMMHNDTLETNCDCLNDCEQIVYEVDTHVSELQYKTGGADIWSVGFLVFY